MKDTSVKKLGVARAGLDVNGLSEGDIGVQNEKNDFAAGNGPVNVLVELLKQESIAASFQNYRVLRPYPEGLYLNLPHLPRDALVKKLYDAILATNFVSIASPGASGKTSLLTMFVHQYPEFLCIPIAFHSSKRTATAVLVGHGVDVVEKTCSIPDNDGKLCVFLLDGCQRQYGDIEFWTGLIKRSSEWLPEHVRFVISATHLLETDAPESPITFCTFARKLTRDDFLISDEEAHECLNLENGLPSNLRFPTLLEVIIRECNGNIGSLRQSIDFIYIYVCKAHSRPTEQDLLASYLSADFVNVMARCFGSQNRPPASNNLRLFLIECLLARAPNCRLLSGQLDDDDNKYLTRLTQAGIVTQDGGYVKFASPSAERY